MLQCYTQNNDLTFKYNKNLGRHGWLRLTPAYSVKLVKNILLSLPKNNIIFEPFSGTATTALVCAEEGYKCYCNEINPFLTWFGKAKCKHYSCESINKIYKQYKDIKELTYKYEHQNNWIPNIFKIQRWWTQETLNTLSALRQSLVLLYNEAKETNNYLPWIAFCRLIIETSSASFNHVSMSFKDKQYHYDKPYILNLYLEILSNILKSTSNKLSSDIFIYNNDSIKNNIKIDFDTIITSPPYPNRISYIRELRPYMYWTKFINDAKEAGELDWQTIGGTWGIATSNLNKWKSYIDNLPKSIYNVTQRIQNTNKKNSPVLAKYVLKYFHDMFIHFATLPKLNKNNFSIKYIIGNSMFYGEMVDTPLLYCDILSKLGYLNIKSSIIRKRNCNKSLYEYLISATYNN